MKEISRKYEKRYFGAHFGPLDNLQDKTATYARTDKNSCNLTLQQGFTNKIWKKKQ